MSGRGVDGDVVVAQEEGCAGALGDGETEWVWPANGAPGELSLVRGWTRDRGAARTAAPARTSWGGRVRRSWTSWEVRARTVGRWWLRRTARWSGAQVGTENGTVPDSVEDASQPLARRVAHQVATPTSLWTGLGRSLALALLFTVWFAANMATILVNKFCFHNLRFHFPVTLTCVHLLFQALFCVVSMDVLQWLPRKRLDRSAYLQRVVPIAAAFAANIAAGNVSLRHVPVSFNQTIKSLTPLTTAMVQYECTRRRLTVAASLSLVPVVGGVALGSATELSWHTWGFFSGVISCFFTGAKFVLSHELLRGQYMLTPLQLVSLVAPAATVMLLPLAVYSEGRAAYTWFVRAGSDPQFLPTLDPTTPATAAMRAAAWIHLASPAGVRLVVLMPLFSGLVALLLNITSFAVLQRTSSVTVTIAGNLKTCLLIGWSILLFQNPVTPLNLFGCVLAVLGCLWHGLLPRKWHIEEAKGG